MMLGHQSKTWVLLAASVIGLNVQSSHRQTEGLPPDDVLLTLSSQSAGNGPDGWCRFSVAVLRNSGGMSARCGPGTPVSAGRAVGVTTRRRALTEVERATVQRLYTSAGLFDGEHVGASQGGGHVPFFMLIARPANGTGPTVALVVSGNASFDSGPRKALFDWLLQERAKLLKAAPSEK
jgi:hypothetical protein